MSAPDGGEGFHRALDLFRDAWAVFREVWGALVVPAAMGWWGWRRWSAGREDEQAKEGRTAEQRREDAFKARFERLDAGNQEYVRRVEGERDRAFAERDRADARADAAERERWRMELWVRDYENALNNVRQVVDAGRERGGQAPADWKPVPRPSLPGDPA